MAVSHYIANVSLDGFVEDARGTLDWSVPSDEVFAFITDLVRDVGTHVLGRGMYEAMAVWETDPSLAQQSALRGDFAGIWQGADKVVVSTTLDRPVTARTTIVRSFDPSALASMKAGAARDVNIGGANLAAQAFAAGLVDECHLFVHPAVLGGGKPALTRALTRLELLDERRFDGGLVYLRYRVEA